MCRHRMFVARVFSFFPRKVRLCVMAIVLVRCLTLHFSFRPASDDHWLGHRSEVMDTQGSQHWLVHRARQMRIGPAPLVRKGSLPWGCEGIGGKKIRGRGQQLGEQADCGRKDKKRATGASIN